MTGNEKDDEDVKTLGEALRAAEDRATGLSTRVEGAEAALATARELHNALLVLVDKRFRELHIEARQQYDRAEKAESALAASREREEGLARAVEGLICGGCGWRLSNPCTRKPCEACDPIKAALSVSVRLALSPAASAEEAADIEREARDEEIKRIVTALARGAPLCDCGSRKPATCVGAYEDPANLALGCDDCCSHGNEDGWCVPIVTAPAASAGAGEEININDPTWVRLTNNGRALYLAHFARMRCHAPVLSDEQGWARFQLWDLAAIFGPHLYNGCDLPFETTIRLSPPPGAPRGEDKP